MTVNLISDMSISFLWGLVIYISSIVSQAIYLKPMSHFYDPTVLLRLILINQMLMSKPWLWLLTDHPSCYMVVCACLAEVDVCLLLLRPSVIFTDGL